MSRVYILLWSFGVCVLLIMIGRFQIVRELREANEDFNFTREFQEKYSAFIDALFNHQRFDNQAYGWLLHNVDRMQSAMGGYGLVDKPFPGIGRMYHNYPLLLNVVAEFREVPTDFWKASIMGIPEDAFRAQDMILRYIGSSSRVGIKMETKLHSLGVCLQEGVRAIVTLPIALLFWTGLIQYSNFSRISNNFFVRLLSVAITLIGLISSVIGIVTGVEPFKKIYQQHMTIKVAAHPLKPPPRPPDNRVNPIVPTAKSTAQTTPEKP